MLERTDTVSHPVKLRHYVLLAANFILAKLAATEKFTQYLTCHLSCFVLQV